MYELSIKGHFDSAHYLRAYPGKCANVHGHTWEIAIEVSGIELDNLGMLIDFSLLKQYLNEILEEFDHKLINDHPVFTEGKLNPTAENIAAYIYQQYQIQLKDNPSHQHVELLAVKVSESPHATATFKGRSTK